MEVYSLNMESFGIIIYNSCTLDFVCSCFCAQGPSLSEKPRTVKEAGPRSPKPDMLDSMLMQLLVQLLAARFQHASVNTTYTSIFLTGASNRLYMTIHDLSIVH